MDLVQDIYGLEKIYNGSRSFNYFSDTASGFDVKIVIGSRRTWKTAESWQEDLEKGKAIPNLSCFRHRRSPKVLK